MNVRTVFDAIFGTANWNWTHGKRTHQPFGSVFLIFLSFNELEMTVGI